MSERYAAAHYGDDEMLSQVQSVNGETIASLRTQLSTVTAQRDAAVEALRNAEKVLKALRFDDNNEIVQTIKAAIAAAGETA